MGCCIMDCCVIMGCCNMGCCVPPRVHMGSGVGFMSHTMCGALVTIVPGVVSVCPTIFCGFIAPDVVREVSAAESAGAIGALCWLVSSPVFAGITAALAALVFVSVGILVMLWGLLLLLPRLCRAHRQLLLHLAHRHCLLLDLCLLVADGFLGA